VTAGNYEPSVDPQSGNPDPIALRQQVLEVLSELSSGQAVSEGTEIATLDLDSMSLSYVFAVAERQYGATFDNDDLVVGRYATASDVCDKVVRSVLDVPG
jgi:hypothetical protein